MGTYNPTPIATLSNQQSAIAAINENFEDIADVLSDKLDRVDALPNQMERDLDMNSNQIINVADPVADGDAVNLRTLRALGGTGGGEGSGVTVHGQLGGLNVDDHPQYFNSGRGDVRYVRNSHITTAVQNALNLLSVNDLQDVTVATPAVGEVLKWNGAAWVNSVDSTSGGSGSANLTFARTATTVTVAIDTGTDAVLPAATTSFAGVFSAVDKTKLDGMSAGATVNSPDSFLLSRANHTGTQLSNTISDFQESVEDLIGTRITSANANATVTYNDTTGITTINVGASGGGATVLNDLNDVSIVIPQEGQFLRYDPAFGWVNSVASVNDIANFRDNYYTDPGSFGPFDGDVMQWDSSLGLWVNEALRRPVFTITGAGLTLGRSHAGKTIRSTNASGITITLPLDSFNETEVGNEGRAGQVYYVLQDQAAGITFSPVEGVSVEYGNTSATTNVFGQLVEVYRIESNRYAVNRLNAVGGGGGAVSSVNGNTGAVVLTSANVNHNNGAGATTRTTQAKLRDWASLADWGAVGDNTTNNATAFAAAEASPYIRIYIPEGTYYTSQPAFNLTKKYWGPGKIRTPAETLPGNHTWAVNSPTRGTGTDFNYFMTGDTRHSEVSVFTLGGSETNIRRGVNEPYFESVTTPYFQWFTNWSGGSGLTAKLASPASTGATSVTLTSSAGLQIGQQLGLNDGTGDTAAYPFNQIVTITSIAGNVVTFTPALTRAFAVGARVSNNARTMNPMYFQQVTHNGPGDSYAILSRMVAGYQPLAGQDHVFYTSTGGLYGGDLVATNSGVFLTGLEMNHEDQGNDIACVGTILNFQRTNATGARGAFWHGVLIKSEGSAAMDSGVCLTGRFRTGLDLANAASNYQSWGAAVGLKRGDGVFFNNQSVEQTLASGLPNPFSLTARAVGDTQIRTNAGAFDPYLAAAARAGDLEYRLQSQYLLASTASAGQPQVTLASAALAAGLQVGQTLRIFDPATSNQQDVVVSNVSGAVVTFTGNLSSTYATGSVLLMAGSSVTARHRIFVRGVETMTIGSQVSVLRQLNVQNPGGSEVTGLNLTNQTNIMVHTFSAGGATTLPAAPKLYIPMKVDGVVYYVPAYN